MILVGTEFTDFFKDIRFLIPFQVFFRSLNLYAPTLQNGQPHSNNSMAVADELFEHV